jgi:DNA-binding IclR family transcriptional regulator
VGSLQDVKVTDLQYDEGYNSRNLSQSVIHSLVVLSRFQPGKEYGVRELAGEIVLNASTTMRYLKTWVSVGALEQNEQTHRYRLAVFWT